MIGVAARDDLIENWAGISSVTPTAAGQLFTLKQHTSGGLGGGTLMAFVGSVADDGGIQKNALGGYYLKRINFSKIYFEDFGVIAGEADSHAKCQTAINACGNAFPNGIELSFKGGIYNLSSALTIGNGNMGTTPSTYNGIKITGTGSGLLSAPPTELIYTGANTSAYLISINGRISDIDVSGLFLNCGGKCNGVYLGAYGGGRISRLKISNPRITGIALIGGTAPVGNYNIFNKFDQIKVDLFTPNSIGLFCDGTYGGGVNNDTWLTTFETLRIECVAGATNAVCAWFKFIDSVTFTRCHFNSFPEPSAIGVIFDSLSNDTFPAGLAFYDYSIDTMQVYEDATHKIRDNYFYGPGVYDNEVLPTHPRLKGISQTGKTFGCVSGFSTQSTSDFNVQNTAALTSVYNYTVPSYFLGGSDTYHPKNSVLKLKIIGVYINASGSNADLTVRLNYGVQNIGTLTFTAIPTGATPRSVIIDCTLSLINGSITNQFGSVAGFMGAIGSSAGGAATPLYTLQAVNTGLTVDSSVASTLDVTVQHSVANGAIAFTLKNSIVELVR